MRFKTGFAVLIFFVVAAIFYNSALAASPTELEREMDRIRRERGALVEEQRRLERELEAINREGQTLGAAVKSLDAARKKITADISVTQSKINSANLSIRSIESNMTEKEREIATHRQALKDIILLLQEHDRRPLVLDVLAAADLSEVWGDRSTLGELSAKLDEQIVNLRETRKVLNQQKFEKEKAVKEQLSLVNQLSGQKSVVEENKKAKERLLAETKNKEAEYQRLLQENIANQKQFEEDLYRLESQLKITLDPSLIPDPAKGVLRWPLDNVFITQKFGNTSFAQSGAYSGKGHNGVDFRASPGTPVKAMLSGVVKGTGNTDEMNAELRRQGKPICGSYGRWVLIEHGNGLSSIYAHLSATVVRTGQTLSTGEVIGYSGGQPGVNGSGYSTGPHLHAGLFASQGVEIRQFTTSKNCKHTTVPIASLESYLDPLSYLPAI